MIHQLIFTKLLGELDYGAGTGMGDFNAAGCAFRSAMQPRCTGEAAGRQQQGPGAGRNACVGRRKGRWRRRMQRRRRTGRACMPWRLWGVLCIALVRVLHIALVRAGGV